MNGTIVRIQSTSFEITIKAFANNPKFAHIADERKEKYCL